MKVHSFAMNFFYILSLFFFSSCALFEQQKIGADPASESTRVCLSAEGRGRLIISNHIFVFNFNSALESETSEWYMALSFPLYGEEVFLVSWDEEKLLSFEASFENKILKGFVTHVALILQQ